jgi:tetratricopeptide (TPR) repeat protein
MDLSMLSFYSRVMTRAIRRTFLLLTAALVFSGCVTDNRSRNVAGDYYNIGNAYADLGQYDKAASAFENALRLDASLVKADFNLALAYGKMKRYDDAAVILKRLLLRDPQNTLLLSTLAWDYHLAGKDGDALEQYDAVLALSPADSDALYDSGIVLWKLDRKDEALPRLKKLLANSPEDTDALFAAASILLATDDAAGSGEMISRYLQKKPDDVQGWYLSAAGAERQQKYSRELEAFDRIIALDAKQADAWFGETRLLLTVIEDPQRGLEALSKALDAGFKDPVAIKALLDSPALLEHEKVEAALKDRKLLPEAAPAPAGTEAAPQSGTTSAPPAGKPAAPPAAPTTTR